MTNSKTSGVLGRTLEGPFFVAVALTVLFYVFVHQEGMRGTALHRYTTAHVTEYIVVTLFFWGVSGLAFHCLGFRRESKALRHAWLPASDGHEPVDSAKALLARVETQPTWLRKTKMGGRLQAALTYVCQKRSADGFEDHLRALSDRGAEQTHANYALQRLIVCVAPLLGLIGTVVHFGTALGGISFDEIQKKLPEVVAAMGTAFDTTTVALGVAMVTMFLLFVAQRAEEGIGYQVDALVEHELAHRFTAQDARLTPFLGTLESAAQSTLSMVQQVVSQQLQAWFQVSQHTQQQDQQHQQRQIEQWSAALARQEERHQALDAQRESRLEQFFAALASQHAEHLAQLATATDHVGGLQQNLVQVAESLSEVLTGESRLLVLQDRLADNLRLLEQTGDLDQAVHGLTAAIHLLTARHDPSTTRNKAA